MAQVIATVEITMKDDGSISVQGTGAILQHKAYTYGLLELAKDVVRGDAKPPQTIQSATLGDLQRFQ